jgi:hypothetical protein
MAFLTLVPPATEPVSLSDLKLYARISETADDLYLGSLITAARDWCETFCERAFVFQTKRLLMDFFPGYIDFKLAGQRVSSPFVSGSNAVLVGIRYAIVLPWPIVRQIVNFTYQDENGDVATLTPGTDCIIDLDSQPARMMPLFGQMWPVARVVSNAVLVDYVTGFGGDITVSTTANSAVLGGWDNFLPRDVGAPICIPGAGASVNGSATTLVTTIASVAANGVATLAVNASAATTATVFFGAVPAMVLTAIKALATFWHENRIPDASVPEGIKAMLYPYRDQRL